MRDSALLTVLKTVPRRRPLARGGLTSTALIHGGSKQVHTMLLPLLFIPSFTLHAALMYRSLSALPLFPLRVACWCLFAVLCSPPNAHHTNVNHFDDYSSLSSSMGSSGIPPQGQGGVWQGRGGGNITPGKKRVIPCSGGVMWCGVPPISSGSRSRVNATAGKVYADASRKAPWLR